MHNTPATMYKEYIRLLEEKLAQAYEALQLAHQNTEIALQQLARAAQGEQGIADREEIK